VEFEKTTARKSGATKNIARKGDATGSPVLSRGGEVSRVLLFPIFSSLIWALAMYWRRRWQSFAVVTVAVVFLLGLTRILAAWHEHLPPMSHLFYELLWPYIVLTGGIGYYICCLPRRFTGELDCRACGYHLVGLKLTDLKCPECGKAWEGKGSGLEPPPEVLIPIPRGPVKKRIM
jgi:hypothetical protein